MCVCARVCVCLWLGDLSTVVQVVNPQVLAGAVSKWCIKWPQQTSVTVVKIPPPAQTERQLCDENTSPRAHQASRHSGKQTKAHHHKGQQPCAIMQVGWGHTFPLSQGQHKWHGQFLNRCSPCEKQLRTAATTGLDVHCCPAFAFPNHLQI